MGKVDHTLNISPSLLDRLLDDEREAGTPFLGIDDVKKPSALVEKLRNGSDPLSKYMYDQFLPETREQVALHGTTLPLNDNVLHAVVVALNEVIREGCLYDPDRFIGVRLPKEVMRLVEDAPKGVNVPYLNRSLLEEYYPDEIHKLRKHKTTYTVRQLKEDVARDLAALLNSRRELNVGVPDEFKQLKGSLLEYGVPDFTAYSLVSSGDRKRIRREVEEALTLFEPRLKSVRVVLEPQQKYDQVLRFRIEALLRVDPAPEPVTFDAMLHMATCEYGVRGV